MRIFLLFLVWLVAIVSYFLMKKEDPENKVYGIYVVAVALMFTIVQFAF